MKRVIIRAPAGFGQASLTAPQAAAIRGVMGQWVMPMPGTMSAAGYQLIDAVCLDSFNPDNIAALELPFDLVGLWQWSGHTPDATEIMPLDEATLLAHLPPTPVRDEAGEVIGSTPAVLHEPHRWAGWPAVL